MASLLQWFLTEIAKLTRMYSTETGGFVKDWLYFISFFEWVEQYEYKVANFTSLISFHFCICYFLCTLRLKISEWNLPTSESHTYQSTGVGINGATGAAALGPSKSGSPLRGGRHKCSNGRYLTWENKWCDHHVHVVLWERTTNFQTS